MDICRESGLTCTRPAVYFDLLRPRRPTGKPCLVLVHGGAHTGTCYLHTVDGRPGWAPFFARHGHPVAVPDWPGTGRSGAVAPDALTGEVVCSGLAGLLDHLGVPVVLLTHSMSGPYGWRLLETHADRIAALVAVAPGPPGNIQPRAEVVDHQDSHIEIERGGIRHRIPVHEPWAVDEDFVRHKLVGTTTRFPRAFVDGYAATLQPLAPRLMHERMNIEGSQYVVANVTAYRDKPVLIVTGQQDRDHPREADAAIADWLTQAGAAVDNWFLSDLGIEGNGHMLMLEENSDEIAALIGTWIEAKTR